ncbi:tyrosinase precursor like protein [Zymoseptoria brevis]|uniref:tyrosinase n=1 Tax=Zymoseptoria brevis TaxID=1047168 RepID=A0A0F4G447_9PEZI|nr:tyrosinase precursor like protein [Zymoseptoria brevis]
MLLDMKLLSVVTLLSLACTSVLAAPLNHEDHSNLVERQSGIVVVTGAPGNIETRYEMRDLKREHPEQWTLFILAMDQWKRQSQGSSTSYFGISAIHGCPRQNYNGIGQCSSCAGTDGYCTHDSILFPAWHRAFTALFEQEFVKIAKNVANSFPASRRKKYVDAANKIRFPFWDWARHPASGMPALPLMLSDSSVTVDTPNGRRTIENPLVQYHFTDNSGLQYTPFITWQNTLRWPRDNTITGVSNNQECGLAFSQIRQSLQDQVYNVLTQCSSYPDFSNDDSRASSRQCSTSLEDLHNLIHITAGGPGGNGFSGGHMTYLPLAAFDPMFWVHHTMVDRIFALWQVINPNSYGGSQVAPHSTWTIPQGSTQDENSPLMPFYRDTRGNFWTTNTVRDFANTFRYTYPEIAGGRNGVIAAVNRLYGPNASNRKRDAAPQVGSILQGIGGGPGNQADKSANSDTSNAATSNNAAPAGGIVPGVGGLVAGVTATVSGTVSDVLSGNPFAAANGSHFQYAANIQTPRYVLGGSYQIFCFNGEPTLEDPTQWVFAKNLIGTMGVMAKEGMEDSPVVISGSIPLTRALQSSVNTQGGLLSNLAEALVVPFLGMNLKWRICGPNGENIDPATLPGFVFEVVTTTYQPPASSEELPIFSDFVPLLDVTSGKAGGANETVSPPSY